MKIEEISDRLMKLKLCIIDMKMDPSDSFKIEEKINQLFPECFDEYDIPPVEELDEQKAREFEDLK